MFSKLVLKHRNPRSITNSPQNKTCVPSVKIANSKWEVKKTYTKIPVTIEAMKVPNIANVTIAPKFEKKGFCKGITLLTPSQKASPYKQSKLPAKRTLRSVEGPTGARLNPDWVIEESRKTHDSLARRHKSNK